MTRLEDLIPEIDDMELFEAELEYWCGILRAKGVIKDRVFIFRDKMRRLSGHDFTGSD